MQLVLLNLKIINKLIAITGKKRLLSCDVSNLARVVIFMSEYKNHLTEYYYGVN